MTFHLRAQVIEQLLEECIPSYQAQCSQLTDGSLAFQFRSRSNSGSFSIVGIRSNDCCNQEQIRLLGKSLLEDLAFAEAGIIASRTHEQSRKLPMLKQAGQG